MCIRDRYKGRLGYTNKGQLREYYGDTFQALADLYLVSRSGETKVIGTDETWLALKSPVSTSGIYDGEMYDARMEPALRSVPVRQMQYAVAAAAPKAPLTPMTGVPVRKREVLPVKEIITTSSGETILDFGQEITGWVSFQAKAPNGKRIILQYCLLYTSRCV